MSVCADIEVVIPGIFKRPDGQYGFRANIPGTKGKQTKVQPFATQSAAYEARNEYLGGGHRHSSGPTVAGWLAEYVEIKRGAGRKLTTIANYGYAFDGLLIPLLGDLSLADLSESDLRSAYKTLVARGLRTATIKGAHDRLRAALRVAVKEQRMIRNPAENVDPPKGAPAKGQDLWTFDQLHVFAQRTASERDAAMWAVWITTGLRRGEMCGLKWPKVNRDTGVLRVDWQRTLADGKIVEDEVKTEAGVRDVPLSPQVLAGLNVWNMAQVPSEYVFTTKRSLPYYPGSFEKRLKVLARRTGLPEISPHDLRHTYASRAVEDKMEITILSKLLGHTRVETTQNLYVHPSNPEAAVANAALADRMFG